MTGYGEAERQTAAGLLRAEIKTVNHRFLNINVRTPAGCDRFEHEMQAWLRPYLARGHAQLVLTLDRSLGERGAEDDLPVLDLDRARHYVGLLSKLREEMGLSGEVDLASILRYDVVRSPEPDEERASLDPQAVREVVQQAAAAVVTMRQGEGARLQEDMEQRLSVISQELDKVVEAAPGRLLRERDRLREAIRELTEQEEVDEDRLAREIAYLAEKWDINEELVRCRSHVAGFREALGGDGGEPVGKRLGFVVQEMQREANTIGAKANDTGIVQASLAIKEEIERLREQVENVE